MNMPAKGEPPKDNVLKILFLLDPIAYKLGKFSKQLGSTFIQDGP